MEAVAPSGIAAAPSQSPVKVSRAAKVEMVGVGWAIVGDVEVAVGVAQADNTQSRRKVVMMRMSVNIIQRIRKIPIQLGGRIENPSGEGSNEI
jgi:hypothetical protein